MAVPAIAVRPRAGRAHDWADAQEPFARPLFLTALAAGEFPPGSRVLDFGCGAGGLAVEAAKRGLEPFGADPSPEMVAVARARLPRGDFRTAPLESMPWPDGFFEGVVAITGFSCVADPLAAMREARRVVRPGGKVIPAVWGRPEDCAISGYLASLGGSAFPPYREGSLEQLATEAGLSPERSLDVAVPFEYPDLASGLRGLQASTPAVAAAAHDGAARVAAITADFLSRYRTAGGRYLLHNRFRMVVARAGRRPSWSRAKALPTAQV